MNHLETLLALHEDLLDGNPFCYFELAYTRQTDWMAWICSKPKEVDPNRKVLACGQGLSPEEAAASALDDYDARRASAKTDSQAP